MSSGVLATDIDQQHSNKGKARATTPEFNEHTPLLIGSTSTLSSSSHDEEGITPQHEETLLSKLLSVFLVSLSFCVLAFIFIALIAYSYSSRTSDISPEVVQRALVLEGPDRLDVVHVTESGDIWLRLDGRFGLDAGEVLGVKPDPEDSFLRDAWKSIGRWGIGRMGSVTVKLSIISISSSKDNLDFLANVTLPQLLVPLTVNPPPKPDVTFSPPVRS